MERALIGEFEDAIGQILPGLSSANLDHARRIAESYMDIRGYGPVKDAAVAEVRARVATSLQEFLDPVSKAA